MSDPRQVISGSAITAITLGLVGLLMVVVLFPTLKVVGALLAVAAIVVGGLTAVNARRARVPVVAPAAGALLGAVALIAFFVWWATFPR